jgi:hypothetical protein
LNPTCGGREWTIEVIEVIEMIEVIVGARPARR